MKAYNAHRVAALYFVPFLLIGFFFLLNFVLALVSNLYMDKVLTALLYVCLLADRVACLTDRCSACSKICL